MDNGSEDGIRVDVAYENRERKDSNSERKTVRFDPQPPRVMYLDLEKGYDPTPRPSYLVRQRVVKYQMELSNRSNAKPPLPPRNNVDPLIALAELLEQPLPPTPPPSPVIKMNQPNLKPKPLLNGQLTVTSRGVQHYRRDPASVEALARSTAVGGTHYGNPALPTQFYTALSMNPNVPPKIPKKAKMPPPPPPPLQPKPSTLKATAEVAVQEEPKPSTSKAAVQEESEPSTPKAAVQVEPKPSTSKTAIQKEPKPLKMVVQVEVHVERKPSTSKAAVQVEPKPSTSKAAVQEESEPSTSKAAVQEESEPSTPKAAVDMVVQEDPKPSTSKAAVDMVVQEEPKPSTSKAAMDLAIQVEPEPSTSKAAIDLAIQVEPMTNGQTQSDGKQQDDGGNDKKHKGKCKIRDGRCKKCERASSQQADDNNHDGPGMRCLLFTIQCLGCSTM
ncbi:proteoglycan 4-like isoform X2 [Aphis gossypii]|uniref:proteoglycan 4-like isoform X2 n=1 Tax=Aphis gossypii TaxID=80765 RepID=UPI002158ADC3|nr:proteoglycan 4-like isoform X2 [Aphis gossypii]